MSASDLTILEDILAQTKKRQDPHANDAEFWEFFSAQQILRDHQLDPQEIKSGLVGQSSNPREPGSDGGIDSLYLFVNRRLLSDSEQVKELSAEKGNIQFDIYIIQSKKEKGFGLEVLNRLSNTSDSIFALDKPISQFAEKYNAPLLELIARFRDAHHTLLGIHPNLRVFYYYVTCGDRQSLHEDIKRKAIEFEDKVKLTLPTIEVCKFEFIGAREIIDTCRKPIKSKFYLKCIESFSNGSAWIALIDLDEYYRLISDNGELRDYLFESNVRDYLGEVEVNKQIRATLENQSEEADFWWLNNGITIIAEKIGGRPKELVLDDPQIVNGLQTSQVIFDYLKQPQLAFDPKKPRHVVIRIIESMDAALRDRIIKATNNQTKIPAQFLRASEEKQRDIEQLFRSAGLHYDRRKNSWRKTNLSFDSIVGITEMAQNVAAIVLLEPDNARARPSRYFTQRYDSLFRPNIPLRTYIVCALLRKRTEAFLRASVDNRQDRNNLLFYVLMALSRILGRKKIKGKLQQLYEIDVESIPEKTYKEALDIVFPIYQQCGADDRAAKGKDMLVALKYELKARFAQKKKSQPSST